MLARAGRLDLLHLVGERIAVPEAVAAEVTEHSDEGAWALGAHEWLERVPAIDIPTAVTSWDLGRGESAVLAWALAHPGALAVTDDHAARTCAKVLGLPLIGTLGLALRAKRTGQVSFARPLVEELRSAGLYLSDQLIREALSFVGE